MLFIRLRLASAKTTVLVSLNKDILMNHVQILPIKLDFISKNA